MFGVKINQKLLKYELIIEELSEAIRQKKLRVGDALPSITKVSDEYGCARETVVKSFKRLKEMGLIESRPSKGYFIASESVESLPKVLLLLNDLTPYMEVLYKEILSELDGKVQLDVFFHHNNIELFDKLLTDNSRSYHSYIVKPFDHEGLEEVLAKVSSSDLLLLDRREGINDERSYICQEFSQDFYMSLNLGMPKLKKYDKINLLYSEETRHPAICKEGFARFCKESKMKGEVVKDIGALIVRKNQVYLVFSDDDLVSILELCQSQGFEIGKDVGIVSYNDTPLKAFVSGGITTISADYKSMGREAAYFSLYKLKVQKFEFASLNLRNSI